MQSFKVYKIKHVYDMFMILQDQDLIHILEHISTWGVLTNEGIQNWSFLSGSFNKKTLIKSVNYRVMMLVQFPKASLTSSGLYTVNKPTEKKNPGQ